MTLRRANVRWLEKANDPGYQARIARVDDCDIRIDRGRRLDDPERWGLWEVNVYGPRWHCHATSRSEAAAKRMAKDMVRRLGGTR